MNDRELADELDAEVKNEHSGKIANLMMRASAALRRSQPEGMVMVPREPTMAMSRAGAEWIEIRGADESPYTTDRIMRAADTYRAMLSAYEDNKP